MRRAQRKQNRNGLNFDEQTSWTQFLKYLQDFVTARRDGAQLDGAAKTRSSHQTSAKAAKS
jgi:hypothetical protein